GRRRLAGSDSRPVGSDAWESCQPLRVGNDGSGLSALFWSDCPLPRGLPERFAPCPLGRQPPVAAHPRRTGHLLDLHHRVVAAHRLDRGLFSRCGVHCRDSRNGPFARLSVVQLAFQRRCPVNFDRIVLAARMCTALIIAAGFAVFLFFAAVWLNEVRKAFGGAPSVYRFENLTVESDGTVLIGTYGNVPITYRPLDGQ